MNIENQSDKEHFSKIPHWLIDEGLIAEARGSYVKVLLIICRYANYTTRLSYPTVKTIVRLSGINKNLVANATSYWKKRDVLEKKRASKRFGFRNCYKIKKPQSSHGSTIPGKTDKCRKFSRDKSGKFSPIPLNVDNGIPSNVESDIYPLNAEKKENLEKKDSLEIKDCCLRDNTDKKQSAKQAALAKFNEYRQRLENTGDQQI